MFYSFNQFKNTVHESKSWTTANYFWSYVKMALGFISLGVVLVVIYQFENHIALLLMGTALTLLGISGALNAYWIKIYPKEFEKERQRGYKKSNLQKLYVFLTGFSLLMVFIIAFIEETAVFKDEFVFWTILGIIMIPLVVAGLVLNIRRILKSK